MLWSVPIQASHEPFGVYEDWSGAPVIHAARWIGGDVEPDLDRGQDAVREVVHGQLRMRFRKELVPGDADEDRSVSANFLDLADPELVDQLSMDFVVKHVTVTGCEANPRPSIARLARIGLDPFNDGSSTGPKDETGDHFLRLYAYRGSESPDPPGVLRVKAELFRCADPECNDSPVVASVDLHPPVRVGQQFTLRVIWDPPNQRFLVGVSHFPDVPIPYTASIVKPPVVRQAFLVIRHDTARCTAASTEADADIRVGTVRTNHSAIVPLGAGRAAQGRSPEDPGRHIRLGTRK